jgi:hypothetical protein
MNTRIGTSFGLALMLALGIIATMLALGMFSSGKVAANDAANHIQIDHVTNAVINSPTTPGETATYTITFQNNSARIAGSGQIYIKFDSLISVPSAIEKERITISASGTGTTIGTSNPLFDPTITTDSFGDTVVVVTIGDAFPADVGQANLPAWDDNSTNANNGHVIIFSALAGIKNSSFPSAGTPFTTAAAWVDMSADGITYNTTPREVEVYRWLSLSSGLNARGTVVTVTGKGFSDGGTATVFRDTTDGENLYGLDSGEIVLGTSDGAISGGTFTSTFTVDTNFTVGINLVNAVDGTGGSANAPLQGDRNQNQKFTLHGKIDLSATSISRGGSLSVTLSDFGGTGGSGTVSQITLGGVQADLTGLTLAYANNTVTIAVTVPSSTPLGTQLVAVTATNEALPRSANVEVAGLTLVVSPSTAVAGQAVTVSGSGFTPSGTIANDGIKVGNITQPLLTSGSAETTVSMDNSGNLVASFTIPNDETTRTPGTHVLRITDSGGRIGEVNVTVPSRTLTLDPTTSKRSSTVTYTGSGYIASTTATITFGTSTVDTVTADSAGNISGSFTVPAGAGIPSANGVTAASACTTGTPTGNICTQTAGAATHTVPGAAITADPVSATSGQTVTIAGTGFPGFVSVAALTIGGVSALGAASATDGNGGFTVSALVPELAAGSQSLVTTVGTGTTAVTATTSFTVTTAPTTPVITTSNTEDVFAAEVTADNLVRVWWFSNELQTWSFFDPRPAFAMANTYTTADTGAIVWVNVTAETTFQGQTLFPGWNLISLN